MVNNSSQGDHIIIISPQIALKPQIQPRIFNPVLISPQVVNNEKNNNMPHNDNDFNENDKNIDKVEEEVEKMLNREGFMSLPKAPEALPKAPNPLPKVPEAPVPKAPKAKYKVSTMKSENMGCEDSEFYSLPEAPKITQKKQ